MTELNYRAYVFVERHLSPIDKGIQSTHAITEFYNEAKLWNKTKDSNNFDKWAHFYKTLILLDGGTVNDLNDLIEELTENGIHHGAFAEPDLDNIITAVSVIVDERVYNTTEYPDFEEWVRKTKGICIDSDVSYLYNKENGTAITTDFFFEEWLEFIGGEKNLKLREFINNKRLAR